MDLNHDEIRRYSRHLILPEVGMAGQKKLKAASVLCIGAGGLGSPIALYLAAAGIGKLGIVPSCAEGGVLGVLPGIIGCIQATEILKLALGAGTTLMGRLLLFNALEMKFRELNLKRDPECPVCGEHPTIKELIDYESFCGITPQPENSDMHPDDVTVQDMKRALDDPKLNIKVIDVREPDEYEIAHVKGTQLLPMSELQQRFTELDPNQQYYLHCHH